MGYGDGSNSDQYRHSGYAVSTGNGWHTIIVSVYDSNATSWIRMRVWNSSSYGSAGTVLGDDIDEQLTDGHRVRHCDANVVLGSAFSGSFDEIVILNYAVTSFEDMNAMEAGTWQSSGNYTWWCDPVNGDANAYGTETSPWPKLGDLDDNKYVNPGAGHPGIRAGDTVYLMEGAGHEKFDLSDTTTESLSNYATITQAPGHEDANLGEFDFDQGNYWKLKGNSDANKLLISPHPTGGATNLNSPGEEPKLYGIIRCGLSGSESHLWIEDCLIRTTTKADMETWDTNDWTTKPWVGIGGVGSGLRGSDHTIRDCTIQYVTAGAYDCSATNMEFNEVDINEIVSDGVFIAGPNLVFTDSHIHNTHQFNSDLFTDPWHVDLFKIGSGSTCTNITVERNKFICCDDVNIPDWRYCQGALLRGDQLSGNFRNNLIVATHESYGFSTGHSLSTIEDFNVVNNTAVRPYRVGNWPTLYMAEPNATRGRYNGTCCVANNITQNVTGPGASDGNVVDTNNFDYGKPPSIDFNDYFMDYGNHDFRPKASDANLTDKGTTTNAPSDDLDGNARDATPDVGAYEYGAIPPAGSSGYIIIGLLWPEEAIWDEP